MDIQEPGLSPENQNLDQPEVNKIADEYLGKFIASFRDSPLFQQAAAKAVLSYSLYRRSSDSVKVEFQQEKYLYTVRYQQNLAQYLSRNISISREDKSKGHASAEYISMYSELNTATDSPDGIGHIQYNPAFLSNSQDTVLAADKIKNFYEAFGKGE